MIIFDHPIWEYLRPYAKISKRGVTTYVDLLQLPDELRALALGVVTNCPACGKVVNCFRARAASERSRIAGKAEERRLFYAATCVSEKDSGCARTQAASEHKVEVMRILGVEMSPQPGTWVEVKNVNGHIISRFWVYLTERRSVSLPVDAKVIDFVPSIGGLP